VHSRVHAASWRLSWEKRSGRVMDMFSPALWLSSCTRGTSRYVSGSVRALVAGVLACVLVQTCEMLPAALEGMQGGFWTPGKAGFLKVRLLVRFRLVACCCAHCACVRQVVEKYQRFAGIEVTHVTAVAGAHLYVVFSMGLLFALVCFARRPQAAAQDQHRREAPISLVLSVT
jgi:hypothetical protein